MILVVAFLGLLGAQGVRLAFGAFVEPWEESFQVSRGTVATVALVSYLIYGLAQPVIGRMVERFDLPRLFAFGMIVIAVGLVLTATSNSTVALVASYGIVASVGFGIAASVVASVLVARWFVAKRGLAFGILEAGFGAGQLVLAPLSLVLIATIGWRSTLLMFAALLAFVLAPLMVLLLRNRPGDVGLDPLGGPDPLDLVVAGRDRQLAILGRKEFWYLGIPSSCAGSPQPA